MTRRRKDVRAALRWSLASYLPFLGIATAADRAAVDAIASGMGMGGGPWTLALVASLATAYMLVVDAALPLGRSKASMLDGACRGLTKSLLDGDGWRARVLMGFSCAVIVQVACDLIPSN